MRPSRSKDGAPSSVTTLLDAGDMQTAQPDQQVTEGAVGSVVMAARSVTRRRLTQRRGPPVGQPGCFRSWRHRPLSRGNHTATVDRLLHHAHICQTSGDSVRLTQALAGQGVSPLTEAPWSVVAPAPLGQIPWPPPGSSHDRHRAGLMTATGQFLLALDNRGRAESAERER